MMFVLLICAAVPLAAYRSMEKKGSLGHIAEKFPPVRLDAQRASNLPHSSRIFCGGTPNRSLKIW